MKTARKKNTAKNSPGSKPPTRKPTLLRGRDFVQEVRDRLGITPEMMKGVVKITPILMRANGGIEACVEALRCDDSPDAILFIDKYDSLTPTDKERLTIEEVTIWSGLTTRRMVEIITGALMTQAQDASNLIVASHRPLIVAKTAERALLDEGERDREVFHKHTGFLPQPKGLSIALNQQNNDNRGLGNGESREPACLAPPSADSFLLEINSTLKPHQKQLETPIEVIANVPELEAEYEDEPI